MNSDTVKSAIVINLCSKLREAGIHFKLLTTFETKETNLPRGTKFWKTEKSVIVDREFAETGVLEEQLIPLNLETRGLQALRTGNSDYLSFKQMVASADITEYLPDTSVDRL